MGWSPKSRCQWDWFLWGLSPRIAGGAFLLSPHVPFDLHSCKEIESSGVSPFPYEKASYVRDGPPSTTSFNPNSLLKDPISKRSHIYWRFHIMNFEGTLFSPWNMSFNKQKSFSLLSFVFVFPERRYISHTQFTQIDRKLSSIDRTSDDFNHCFWFTCWQITEF